MRAFRCAISRPRLGPAGCFCLVEAGAGTGDRERGSGVIARGDVVPAAGLAAAGLAAAAAADGRDWWGVISALERVTRARGGGGGAAGGGRRPGTTAGADGCVRLRKRLGDIGRMTSSSSVAMLVGRHSGGDVTLLSALMFMRGRPVVGMRCDVPKRNGTEVVDW